METVQMFLAQSFYKNILLGGYTFNQTCRGRGGCKILFEIIEKRLHETENCPCWLRKNAENFSLSLLPPIFPPGIKLKLLFLSRILRETGGRSTPGRRGNNKITSVGNGGGCAIVGRIKFRLRKLRAGGYFFVWQARQGPEIELSPDSRMYIFCREKNKPGRYGLKIFQYRGYRHQPGRLFLGVLLPPFLPFFVH